jgi:hypothetical protein
LCTVLLFLSLSGGFNHELGGDPDEAAHFVTGLMIHDYVRLGTSVPPFEFAKEYYGHYPKMAFGIWPPLFHTMEAGWMLLVSPSKISVLILLSLIAASLAYFVFATVARQFGFTSGMCAGLFLVSLPMIQQSTNLVMLDSCVALFSFIACLHFGRYLDSDRWQEAALFGIWAAAAILTKYNGLALALLPPLCALLSGRWRILLRGKTWLPAGVVLVICGAWYIPMRQLVSYAAEPLPSFSTVLPGMMSNSMALYQSVGLPVLIVAGVGVYFAMSRRHIEFVVENGVYISAGALIASYWLFHSIVVPAPAARYMESALPAVVVFAALGVHGMSRMLRRPPLELAVAVVVLYAMGPFRVTETPRFGLAELASRLTGPQASSKSIILADGDPPIEGIAVSEVAVRDRSLSRYVLRGSKVLARSTWMGAEYRQLYHTPEEILKALDSTGVSVVIVQSDTTIPAPHRALLRQALKSAQATWALWSEAPWGRHEKQFLVYRRIQPIEGRSCFEVSLEWTLHLRWPVCTP